MNEDIVRKQGKRKLMVLESHDIIEATVALNLVELRLVQLTLATMYQGEEIQRDKLYTVHIKDYADWFGLSMDAAYHALTDAALSLAKSVIILKEKLLNVDANSNAKRIIQWVDSIRYDPLTHEIQLEWGKYLIPFLNNYGKDNLYSKYYLENTCKMQSTYSIKLYRVLNKWVKTGKLERDIDEIKRLIGLQPEDYMEFDNFRRKVLIVAVDEINNLSNLTVSFENVCKVGRKVTGIRFKISGGNNVNKIRD